MVSKIKYYKNFDVQKKHKNSIILIGNFDGVHLGHQHLIKKIIKNAKLNQLRSAMLTFVPHPKIYFNRTSESIDRRSRFTTYRSDLVAL